MSGQWHYSQDGAQYGPVDEMEIIRLIQDGELAPGSIFFDPAIAVRFDKSIGFNFKFQSF